MSPIFRSEKVFQSDIEEQARKWAARIMLGSIVVIAFALGEIFHFNF